MLNLREKVIFELYIGFSCKENGLLSLSIIKHSSSFCWKRLRVKRYEVIRLPSAYHTIFSLCSSFVYISLRMVLITKNVTFWDSVFRLRVAITVSRLMPVSQYPASSRHWRVCAQHVGLWPRAALRELLRRLLVPVPRRPPPAGTDRVRRRGWVPVWPCTYLSVMSGTCFSFNRFFYADFFKTASSEIHCWEGYAIRLLGYISLSFPLWTKLFFRILTMNIIHNTCSCRRAFSSSI